MHHFHTVLFFYHYTQTHDTVRLQTTRKSSIRALKSKSQVFPESPLIKTNVPHVLKVKHSEHQNTSHRKKLTCIVQKEAVLSSSSFFKEEKWADVTFTQSVSTRRKCCVPAKLWARTHALQQSQLLWPSTAAAAPSPQLSWTVPGSTWTQQDSMGSRLKWVVLDRFIYCDFFWQLPPRLLSWFLFDFLSHRHRKFPSNYPPNSLTASPLERASVPNFVKTDSSLTPQPLQSCH